MGKYFDIGDVLSWKDRDTVKVGDEGYFSASIAGFDDLIHNDKIDCLYAINNDDSFCFAYADENYKDIFMRPFFLPKDKVRKSTYRPSKTFDGLFNKEDVKSWTNCSEVKIGEEGYFGYNLLDLEYRIKNENPKKLTEINVDSANSFKVEGEWFPFFLSIYNVKKQDPTYRPLKTFDELFNFLMPNNDEKDPDRKAELLLGKVYRLKEKTTGNLSYRFFHVINQYDGIIRINGLDLEYLFDKYEIKKNGKWVPFGIKEE